MANVRSRHDCAHYLAQQNKLCWDQHCDFEEEGHKYTVFGKIVPTSVTGLVSMIVKDEDKFDGPQIAKKNLTKWRSNAQHKFHDIVSGVSDDEAVSAVVQYWKHDTQKGTALHSWIENYLNGNALAINETLRPEIGQFTSFDFHSCMDIFRTELLVYYAPDSDPTNALCAGQIDAVFSSGDKLFIVDFKRTENDLTSHAFHYGKYCKGVLENIPLTPHTRYSFQQSLYAIMLERLIGSSISEMYLLQMHSNLDDYKLVRCTDYRPQARILLESLTSVSS